ncbi:hypothetical protein LTR84_002443 [Exophiala bonariae]|uniref:Carrier domain-containing protein n=1 Tax=Exophiala bonariae TaxID=1690606 RepID=A0AAV9NAU2_9EURO|nr:hypothetical protein LTR84_002443 [Exophiala bonariae]
MEESSTSGAFGLNVRSSGSKLFITTPEWATLLSPEMAGAQVQGYTDILQRALMDEEQTVSNLIGTLGAGELTSLWEWNGVLPPTISRCIHEIIAERSAEHPEKHAVTSWEGDLTYSQLDRASLYLANQLSSMGVKLGAVVPLCFEKSIWTVVALLAIMRAGGTFVLTDPSQPEGRLSTIVSEVDAQLLITSQKQASLGSRIAPDAKIVVVGPELLWLSEQEIHTTLPTVPATAVLYIVFTSGSTGKPKGVVISHENFTTGAIPRAKAVGYKPQSRVLDFPSYAFDVSIDCMLCTLANGGCICVPSDEQRINNLSEAIRSMDVNMAHMTPSVARVLSADALTRLEVLGLGGESLSPADATLWSKVTKVIIAYGPSECTVGCTINNEVDTSLPYTTIGRGVGGVTWIVDPGDHDVLTPIGAVGELLVEGSIVGLGYLKEQDKTREVFINDPKWLVTGSKDIPGRHGRLYKTGDLVKYDRAGSGNLVFVGRKDRQVKLRGQRVELLEIEYHLRRGLPQEVRIAVEVITPGGKHHEPSLVAFISEEKHIQAGMSEDSGHITAFSTELLQSLATTEEYLLSELPSYMIPTAYIPLRSMPLMISCKVDRKKLQEIGHSLTAQRMASLRTNISGHTEPRTKVQQVLQEIWNNLLATNTYIHANDNFFTLGGDSLKAMRLVAMARDRDLSLTVTQIFCNPTLSRMASIAEQATKVVEGEVLPFSLLPSHWTQGDVKQEVATLCKLTPFDIEDIYPCTPLQEGLMALSAKLSDTYIAQRVAHLADPTMAYGLKAAWQAVTSVCPILRTRIVQVPNRGLMQVVVKSGSEWFSSNSLEDYLQQDRDSPMELGAALARFGLVTTEEGKFHIVLTIHHAVYDGWMMPLVIDRVKRSYQGLELSPPVPFRNFINYLAGSDQRRSQDFWREQLRGANPTQFPVVPYPGYQPAADSLLEHRVDVTIRSFSNTTIATAIRGAWALSATKYTSSEDVIFGETVTGRNAPVTGICEIEGPLITTIPVRIHSDRTMLVSEFLHKVQEETVLRIPHEHMGLQHIRRLSADALYACDLRTGLVLHPNTEDPENASPPANLNPADAFAPLNDREAAEEALKFNSYALMLVCSLDRRGFLIMASFDSHTIDTILMQKVLEEFGRTVEEFCSPTDKRISDLLIFEEPKATDLLVLSKNHFQNILPYLQHEPRFDWKQMKGIWIVDPRDAECLLPIGAVGEVLLEAVQEQSLVMIEKPNWFSKITIDGDSSTIYKSGYMGKFRGDGTVVFLGSRGENTNDNDQNLAQNGAPTKETESKAGKMRLLSRLWSSILNIPEVDISSEADFFSLGGDSIAAMKLVSEVRIQKMTLTVEQVFRHRQLDDMAHIMEEESICDALSATPGEFTLLDCADLASFITQEVVPILADSTWTIKDIIPCRPLQEIAVRGTTQLPRFSVRYELFYLEGIFDRQRLFMSCQELVSRNEILRTVFLSQKGRYYGVVLEKLDITMVEYAIEGDLREFATNLCNLDVQTKMAEGTPFLKFFFVQKEHNQACLIMRISHAQYDEICLPGLLHQLAAIHAGKEVPETLPFSRFVYHATRDSMPKSINYWRRLLEGSSMTKLAPSNLPLSNTPAAVSATVDISSRLKSITTATLPPAAWALCLARRLSLRDVTFGEVVSGRNTGLPNAHMIMGPTWQYVPVRVKFEDEWSAKDLLESVQQQHIDTSRFEAMGLSEIIRNCTDWPEKVEWFDSVVHQDVDHVNRLPLISTNSRIETIYPHPEPLRELKFQAFCKGDSLTLEIVTFEDWLDFGKSILDDLCDCLKQLVNRPTSALFESATFENIVLHISDTVEVVSVTGGGAFNIST